MPTSQPARIKTSLAAEDLLFLSMDGTEELGRPFVYYLELLSPKEDLSLDDVLGQDATVELDLPSGETRYFHGHVTHFSQTGRRGDYATYRMQLRPWLWFLTRTADCRIFQEQTVPEIIKEVFREHGHSDFEDLLNGSYRTWEYCVQYRETDFNFVSRLMEQEGIYYFFTHENGKHTLVLADSYGAHSPLEGYDEIPYFPPSKGARDEHIYDWYLGKSVQPGQYVLRAYDFRKPKANLEVNSAVSRDHAQADYEVFDYPGEHFERDEGDVYARARVEELQAQHERVRGVCDVRGICAGGLFTLADYPRKDQNREYLVLSSRQSISVGGYESGNDEGFQLKCRFEAMDSQIPYRVARVTRKPLVQGPQTAIVSGKSGEEIWTDEYGRVKVQFHWDRQGKADENSSCWVRVAQPVAGANWGGISIPRMGQEVIVEFIEGDPDRPIITGRVYNADNMPPYGLPDNKTQTGLKSRSSKGGSADNFNEIRFEDKIGAEEMYIHAEKDQTIMVENDKAETVGHDNTENIGNDETIEVGNNRDKTVGVDQSEAIGSNKKISVGADHEESIGANKTLKVASSHRESIGASKTLNVGGSHNESIGSSMTVSVGKNLTETVAVNYAETVGAAMELTIGAAMLETIGADKTQTIGNNKSVTIGADESQTIGKNKSEKIGDSMMVSVGKDQTFDVGKNLVINAGEQIAIKTGSASIIMKKDGTINIQGKDITIKGSGAIKSTASKDIVMKGKKVLQN